MFAESLAASTEKCRKPNNMLGKTWKYVFAVRKNIAAEKMCLVSNKCVWFLTDSRSYIYPPINVMHISAALLGLPVGGGGHVSLCPHPGYALVLWQQHLLIGNTRDSLFQCSRQRSPEWRRRRRFWSTKYRRRIRSIKWWRRRSSRR